jgi:hypothetical protein
MSEVREPIERYKASTGTREWDGVDVFPIRDGKIARKDAYSASHRPREL